MRRRGGGRPGGPQVLLGGAEWIPFRAASSQLRRPAVWGLIDSLSDWRIVKSWPQSDLL